jgi:uncharacterized cupredoxin-like copper-binding protein
MPLVVLVAALASTLALPALSRTGTAASTTVVVTAGKPSELHFALSKSKAPKGTVVFKVTNKGQLPHDFKIAGKKTALIKPGKTVSLTVTFAKTGSYAYQCTVPGHAAAGMKGVFKVS